jgi:hypothetical protein
MNNKLKVAYSHGNSVPRRFKNCFASLDGTRFQICRPSGDNNQQAGVYNAYYGYHNLGFEGITAPDGMFIQFAGPYAGADNDLNMLHHSRSVIKIRQA